VPVVSAACGGEGRVPDAVEAGLVNSHARSLLELA
jgi:hypothetical protein